MYNEQNRSIGAIITARKTLFSFSNCSEKLVFHEKSHWNMIFLLSSGKMALLFPENMIIFLRTENERLSFSKNTFRKRWAEKDHLL